MRGLRTGCHHCDSRGEGRVGETDLGRQRGGSRKAHHDVKERDGGPEGGPRAKGHGRHLALVLSCFLPAFVLPAGGQGHTLKEGSVVKKGDWSYRVCGASDGKECREAGSKQPHQTVVNKPSCKTAACQTLQMRQRAVHSRMILSPRRDLSPSEEIPPDLMIFTAAMATTDEP